MANTNNVASKTAGPSSSTGSATTRRTTPSVSVVRSEFESLMSDSSGDEGKAEGISDFALFSPTIFENNDDTSKEIRRSTFVAARALTIPSSASVYSRKMTNASEIVESWPRRESGGSPGPSEEPTNTTDKERNDPTEAAEHVKKTVRDFTLSGVQPFTKRKTYRPISFNPQPPPPPPPPIPS
nr:PREDICTED: uncharacterized protein LOC105663755 [Megachile rotundata]